MTVGELVPIVVITFIIATAIWVYTDARTRSEAGAPVVFSLGPAQLDSPEVWAVVCLIIWVLCFPL